MHKVFVLLAALAALALTPSLALAQSQAQTWNITVYDPREHRPWHATLILKEKDGAATVETLRPGMTDPCVRATKATVERTDTTITITKEPYLRDCRPVRYIIKADGTGGKAQFWDAATSTWIDDPRERNLTLIK